jgi:hypothetical protein
MSDYSGARGSADYRARAEVIEAFVAETISPDLRDELTLLAEGYRQLAREAERRLNGKIAA